MFSLIYNFENFNSAMYLFANQILNTYYVLGLALGSGDDNSEQFEMTNIKYLIFKTLIIWRAWKETDVFIHRMVGV